LNDDFWGILALIAAGESEGSEIIQNACEFIKSWQNEDGGWSWQVGDESDVDDTGAAIMALIAAGEGPDSFAVEMGLLFLMDNQNDDGGFPWMWGGASTSASCAWGIGAIVAAGQDPSSDDWEWDDNPVGCLLNLQDADGAFKYTASQKTNPVFMTAYAIPALLGDPYPVEPVDYEPPPPQGQADLIISSVYIPATIYKSDDIEIAAIISNTGGQDITDSFICSLSINGITEDAITISSLASGSSTEIELYWTPSATGSHTLVITADVDNSIEETSDGNNSYSTTVTVNSRPVKADLTISDIDTDSTIYAEVETIISITIENSGETDIYDSFQIKLYDDKGIIDTATIDELDAGDVIEIDFEWTLGAAGEYILEIIADPVDSIDESNENNNEESIEAKVTEQLGEPDITVADISVPASINADATVTITATITNIGDADISGSFKTILKANGIVVDTLTVTVLDAGDSLSANFHWIPGAAGSHVLQVVADSEDSISEDNETNNYSGLENIIATTIISDNSSQEESPPTDSTVEESSGESSAAVPPAISVDIEPENIDFGDLVPGETSAEFEITITHKGNQDMLVTADLAGDAQDFYASTLRLNGWPWDVFEIVVPKESSVVIRATLSVPQSYDGQIIDGGVLIFWSTVAP
jgi:hypothetical protein